VNSQTVAVEIRGCQSKKFTYEAVGTRAPTARVLAVSTTARTIRAV
jgi:hypothetical protein